VPRPGDGDTEFRPGTFRRLMVCSPSAGKPGQPRDAAQRSRGRPPWQAENPLSARSKDGQFEGELSWAGPARTFVRGRRTRPRSGGSSRNAVGWKPLAGEGVPRRTRARAAMLYFQGSPSSTGGRWNGAPQAAGGGRREGGGPQGAADACPPRWGGGIVRGRSEPQGRYGRARTFSGHHTGATAGGGQVAVLPSKFAPNQGQFAIERGRAAGGDGASQIILDTLEQGAGRDLLADAPRQRVQARHHLPQRARRRCAGAAKSPWSNSFPARRRMTLGGRRPAFLQGRQGHFPLGFLQGNSRFPGFMALTTQ